MKLDDLAIYETDILELGIKDTDVSRVLKCLFEMVVEGYVKNERDDLIEEAKVYSNLLLNY